MFSDVEQIGFPGTTRNSRQYAGSDIYRNPSDGPGPTMAGPQDEFGDQKQAIASFSRLVDYKRPLLTQDQDIPQEVLQGGMLELDAENITYKEKPLAPNIITDQNLAAHSPAASFINVRGLDTSAKTS